MVLYFREGHVSSNQIVDLKIRPQDAKIHVDSHLVDATLSSSAIFKHCYYYIELLLNTIIQISHLEYVHSVTQPLLEQVNCVTK